MPAPKFENSYEWSREQLTGYLSTWSALKHFQKQNDYNPLNKISEKIGKEMTDDKKIKVTFPILLRIGKLE